MSISFRTQVQTHGEASGFAPRSSRAEADRLRPRGAGRVVLSLDSIAGAKQPGTETIHCSKVLLMTIRGGGLAVTRSFPG